MAPVLKGDASLSVAAQRRIEHHEADVVIVGAGVLGCALAVALGNQGRSVILLEKSLEEPNRIVGELLQPGGVQALEQLGLRDCLEDIDGIDVKGYWVSYFGEPVLLEYPKASPTSPTPLGRAFHHGRFVMKLRAAALSCPNVTVVETKVTDLVISAYTQEVLGVECVTKEVKDCYFGQLTVAADGYNSDFRKQHHQYTPKRKSKFYGLELIDAKLPAPNTGHVLLSDNPPVLMYQIGTHETRILVDIPDNLPLASVKNGGVKGYMRNNILPQLPEGAQKSFADALEQGQLRSMPNSFLPASVNKTPGLMILGDALNMRHPLTGGGMTVALNDVCLIRELLSPERVPTLSNTGLVLEQLAEFHWRRKNSSSVINILAQALYALFAADNQYLKALQRGCFRYFQIGPVGGPVGLLAGLIKKPLVLVSHFFSVAFLSIWVLICDTPLPRVLLAPYYAFMILYTASIVILPYIWTEIWY
ncbi:Squalene epoxidase [Penicillium expansum]|uniref:Squalene monooxygenase n=1 Tax=Penicillium expansum TaxID=27334 RepID=A0A0A2JX27_PENEN|nr:Squalene epoxidase [Penicillium expansum]KGO36069.1 Squalene epoxidase [Penicillium expansum]KGO59186.1 Squalene epoxidase [Penicillium expansum]KGO59391.1 Squalene epoxidase [Penicillium expansum]